ncbi:MAG: acyl--CoA ligase [Oscillospiraceae bacterium]|nr:acyl--CoA ligase [Oscillospiraceae bacterium]
MKATEAKPWLKHYDPEVLSREMPELSVVDYLLQRNEKRMHIPALNYFDRIFDHTEVYENTCRAANAYASIGVKRGDIVVCCAPTTPETVYTFYGLSMLGAVSNMIDPRYSAEGMREHILETDSRYVMVIDVAYEKMLEAVKGTRVEKVIVVSPAESLPKLKRFAYCLKNPMKKNMPEGFVGWGEFIEKGGSFETEYLHDQHGDCCVIVHTGGTTGRAKSTMLSHDNINAVSFQYTKSLMRLSREEGKDKFLNIMPPFVAYGLGYGVHIPLASGICSVLIPQFKPEEFAKLVLHHRPQDVAGTPAHFLTLMKDPRMKNADLSCFKNACAGGDGISLQNEELVSEFLMSRGCEYPLTKGYGMTELAAVSTACMLQLNRHGSVGIPHADFLIAAFDPDTGEELEIGQVGEICINGPTMMMGYYNNQAETEHIMRTHADGRKWIHTGDLGYMDEDGFLYIQGRIKRVIIRVDGFKVYPHGIEDVICSCPEVHTATVVGTPAAGEVQGQVPHAFFTLRAGCAKSEEEVIGELKELCRRKLAEYAQPVYFTCIPEMPMTSIGKIDYKQLEGISPEHTGNA